MRNPNLPPILVAVRQDVARQAVGGRRWRIRPSTIELIRDARPPDQRGPRRPRESS